MPDQLPSNNPQEIYSQYAEALVVFNRCIKDILDPINERLIEKKEKAFSEFSTEPRINEIARAKCLEAHRIVEQSQRIMEQLGDLVRQAAFNDIDLGKTNLLDEELEKAELKRVLAWSLEAEELQEGIEKASVMINADRADGTIINLYEQAGYRRSRLLESMKLVSSTELKARDLQSLMSQINNLDEAPIQEILQIKAAFDQILDLNQTFTRFNVERILDERIASNREEYVALPKYTKQRDDIRKTILSVIDEFIDKALRLLDDQPSVSETWFKPVEIFRDYLDEEIDKKKLVEIKDLYDEIQSAKTRWDEAEKKLSEADLILRSGAKTDSCWQACLMVKMAEEEFPNHVRIDSMAKYCIESTTNCMLAEMANKYGDWVRDWPTNETCLVNPPVWQNHWLKGEELPSWLQDAQADSEARKKAIENYLVDFTEKLGKKCAEKQVDLIGKRQENLNLRFEQNKNLLDNYISKRKEIRSFIASIQALILQGQNQEDQNPFREAQNKFNQFLEKNPGWRQDVELEETKRLLLQFLSATQALMQACVAFEVLEWDDCIAALEQIGGAKIIKPLSPQIDDRYLRTKLQAGKNETLHANEIPEFAHILFQLAHVYEAVREIGEGSKAEMYDTVDTHLNAIAQYGRGNSPIVRGLRDAIRFDDLQNDCNRRRQGGNTTFQDGKTLNELTGDYFIQCEGLISSPSTERGWLDEAQKLLDNFERLDPEKKTLWVGKIDRSKRELMALFYRQLNQVIEGLSADMPDVPFEKLQRVMVYFDTARRYGFYLQLQGNARRAVTFNYYLSQENSLKDFRLIAMNWRKAVAEFSSDSEVVKKFHSASWNWWLHEIDEALLLSADGIQNQDAINDLFSKKETRLPYLFTAVKSDGGKIAPALDLFDPQIKVRQRSWEILQKADRDLISAPEEMPLIVKELLNAEKKLNRPELLAKAMKIGREYVLNEVTLGFKYLRNRNSLAAVEHFLRAVSLKSWNGAAEWIKNSDGDIRGYWTSLQREINDFNGKEGTIHEQYKVAQRLSIRLEEFHACDLGNPYQKEIDPTAQILLQKSQLLDFGLQTIDLLMPGQTLWNKATNPNERFVAITDAWKQFKRYLSSLISRFGADHVQVDALETLSEHIYNNIKIHLQSSNTLQESFNRTEEYGSCMVDCMKVIYSINSLIRAEGEYYGQWRSWVGAAKIDESMRYFEDRNKVLGNKKWCFILNRDEEIPFYLLGHEFEHWVEKLHDFVIVTYNDRTQEEEYRFDRARFGSLFQQDTQILSRLRKQQEKKEIFLGNLLILAQSDKDLWMRIGQEYEEKQKIFFSLYRWLTQQDIKKSTELWLREYLNYYNKWVDKLKAHKLQESPVPLSSSDIRTKIEYAIYSDDKGDNEDGEIIKLKKSADVVLKTIKQKEQDQLEKFKVMTQNINHRNITTDTLDNISSLKLFYKEGEVPKEYERDFAAIGVPVEEIKKEYLDQYKPRYTFFCYVESLTEEEAQ